MTDIERIEKVNRMQALGAVIWKPTLVPYVELKVEKDGKVLTHINKLCESFNRNFFVMLTAWHGRTALIHGTFGNGYLCTKSTSSYLHGDAVNDTYLTTSAGSVNCGIVLGTATTAESFEHYSIQTLITHGNTSGTLAYQAQAAPSHTWTVGTLTWEIDHIRVFNNNSGGLITVNGVGLYLYQAGYYDYTYMILRDLLAVGVDVPDAAQLTVTYHLQMVFPE
jgi:hypothetical protein